MQRALAYCTNVHAGADLEQTVENLRRHALAVKRRVSPNAPMGIGLWLAASAARALRDPMRLTSLRTWLGKHELIPFTLNGFPFGDFHQKRVKYDVYQPNWFDQQRLVYTQDLIRALDGLLPEGVEGSISTLPISWAKPLPSSGQLQRAARYLRQIAVELAELESRTGRLIYLCLEPEPGCLLECSKDVVRFFGQFLLPGAERAIILRHLRVCHDICHAAVMFEDQTEAIDRLQAERIQIGKAQVSSAIRIDAMRLSAAERVEARDQLLAFAEDRYLHQTTVLPSGSQAWKFFDDLPEALLQAGGDGLGDSQWRVHFHVPIFLDRFGLLGTTQKQIDLCINRLRQTDTRHYEIETYAWGVLPKSLQGRELADGIAQEMQWLTDRFDV